MRAKDSIGEWYRDVPLSAKWPIFTGLAMLVVWLGCFGVWAGVAPLNSAVVASGTFRPLTSTARTPKLLTSLPAREATSMIVSVIGRNVRPARSGESPSTCCM